MDPLTAGATRSLPESPAAALVAVQTLGDALVVLTALRERFLGAVTVEYFHDDGLRLVLALTHQSSPFGRPYPLYLLVEVAPGPSDPSGPVQQSLVAVLEELPEVRDLVEAPTEIDRQRVRGLWLAQSEAVRAEAGPTAPIRIDVVLPPAALARFEQHLPEVLRAVSRSAVPILFGSLVEARVQVNVLHAESDRCQVSEAVLGLVDGLGGAIEPTGLLDPDQVLPD